MGRVIYTVSNFNADKASKGALCIAIKNDATITNGTISNITVSATSGLGTPNSDFLGAGICKYVVPNKFFIVLGGVTYEFNSNGIGRSNTNSAGYVLKLAAVNAPILTGSTIRKNSVTTITGSRADGSASPSTNYNQVSNITVASLNARDEFAVHALRELLCHTEDPSVLSDGEMNFYCNAAYKWAANMMVAAADARSDEDDNAGDNSMGTITLSGSAETALKNIVDILKRNDYTETDLSGTKTYYDNVKIRFDELITFLNTYVKKGTGVVGLNDLITAIKAIETSVTNKEVTTNVTVNLTDLVEAVNNTKTVKLSSIGVGGSTSNPLHISGGVFPSKSALAAEFVVNGNSLDGDDTLKDFVTFNENGAVGYTNKSEIAKLIDTESIKSSTLSYVTSNLLTNILASINESIDSRIKSWLAKSYVETDDNTFAITYPDNIDDIDDIEIPIK